MSEIGGPRWADEPPVLLTALASRAAVPEAIAYATLPTGGAPVLLTSLASRAAVPAAVAYATLSTGGTPVLLTALASRAAVSAAVARMRLNPPAARPTDMNRSRAIA